MEAERDKYCMINFEETELRLGLPGRSSSNDGESSSSSSSGLRMSSGGGNNNKRGFSETAAAVSGVVDLKLNLSSSSSTSSSSNNDLGSASSSSSMAKDKSNSSNIDPAKPLAKAQVVGWPPVRSFRKNIVNNVQRSNKNKKKEEEEAQKPRTSNGGAINNAGSALLVKVSVDGAAYLRKVDLKLYKSYKELSDAVAKMFSSFTTVNCGSQSQGGIMNESKLMMDLLNKNGGSEYVPTYQDKDGDWMLVGDVPWEMFVESCKRLRIMKGSEASGLAPIRAVEKSKIRS